MSQWCYVDAAACSQARKPVRSSVLPGNAYYSYHTCGYLDEYSAFAPFPSRPLRISTGISPPYIVEGSSVAGWPYDGALVKFADTLVRNFASPPAFNVTGTFATVESMAVMNGMIDGSPYSACVHDVAVGNYDLCAVDIWMLPERLLMADFLPPFDTEYFYLMVPEEPVTELSFSESIERTFMPFTNPTWLMIGLFLLGASLASAFVEWDNTDDYPYESRGARAVGQRVGMAACFGVQGWLTGGWDGSASTSASRVIKGAVLFFVFITQSMFTANLAAILVTEASANKIESMNDAIDAGLKICHDGSITARLKQAYPKGDFHDVGWAGMLPRNLKTNGGTCDVAVMPELYWLKMRAGDYSAMDCGDDALLQTQPSACKRDVAGEPDLTRDCGYIRVGELLTTVPVSMPVSSELVHALGWSTLQLLSQGLVDELRTQRYADKEPKSVCPAKKDPSLSLAPRFLKGCVGISGFLVIVGLTMHSVGILRKRWSPEGESSATTQEEVAAHGDADVREMLDMIGKAHVELSAKLASKLEVQGQSG